MKDRKVPRTAKVKPEITVQPPLRRIHSAISLAIVVLLAFVSSARGAALELYPTDFGTASAGQAAIAENASTAASNPAGMTLLDRSQLMAAPGALLPSTNFDVAPQTTTSGGGGGNSGVFMPLGAFFYVHNFSERVRLGVAVFSDYGLSGGPGKTWVGRYYVTEESLITGKVNPSIAYEVNDWLSVGAGFSFGSGVSRFNRRLTTLFRACRMAASRWSRGTKRLAVMSAYCSGRSPNFASDSPIIHRKITSSAFGRTSRVSARLSAVFARESAE